MSNVLDSVTAARGRRVRLRSGMLVPALVLGCAAAGAAAPVTLTVEVTDDTGNQGKVMRQWVQDYLAAHPDVTINAITSQGVEKNAVAIAAGSGPDLIISDWNAMTSYTGNDLALPLDELAKKDGFDLSQFYPSVLAGYSAQGHLYELPIQVNTHVMIYNKDLFDQSGVVYPGDWDWDALRSNAKKLTHDTNGDGTPDQFGFGLYTFYFDGFIGFIWQNDGHIYSEEGGVVKSTYTDPKTEEAVQYLVDLMYKDRVMMNPNIMADDDGMFTTDKVAAYFEGDWHLHPVMQAAPSLNWDMALVPKNAERAIELGGIGYLINKNSKHPEAAWDFMKYVAANDAVQNSVVAGGLGESALRRIQPPSYPGRHTDALLQSMNYMRKFDVFPQWSQIYDSVVAPNLSQIWAGKAPVKPTLEKITAQSNAILGW